MVTKLNFISVDTCKEEFYNVLCSFLIHLELHLKICLVQCTVDGSKPGLLPKDKLQARPPFSCSYKWSSSFPVWAKIDWFLNPPLQSARVHSWSCIFCHSASRNECNASSFETGTKQISISFHKPQQHHQVMLSLRSRFSYSSFKTCNDRPWRSAYGINFE